MKRQTGPQDSSTDNEQLEIRGSGGSSGGTVTQGPAGSDPWLFELTPTQIPLPVSGTVTTGGLTDTQLRATPVPISGTVTANAGTNLNTSALALESGGNLAAITASASVLDDWDESDRAKVNLIAGQAGVDGNSGNKSAATQRVVLATDQPLIPAIVQGASTIATGQVSVTTTSGTIVASRATRRRVTIVQHGATAVYFGPGTISTTTGSLLIGTTGSAVTLCVTSAINGIVASGSQTVSYIEEYD